LEPWALGGRPDDETVRRLVQEEGYSDSDIARLYGVARQTGTYYRLKAGLRSAPAGEIRDYLTRYDGSAIDLFGGQLVASNGRLHNQMRTVIDTHRR